MSVRVRHDRVLVRPLVQTSAAKAAVTGDDPELNRIFDGLAHTAEPDTIGTVVALGDGTPCPRCQRALAWDFAVGAVVIFSPLAGQDVYVDADRFILLRAAEVLAVVEPSAEDVTHG